jgi:hypothetical protein
MKKRQKLLTDEQWRLIEPLLPEPRRRKDNRGRPWASNRACFEGILWILQTGAAWRFLPDEFPSPSARLEISGTLISPLFRFFEVLLCLLNVRQATALTEMSEPTRRIAPPLHGRRLNRCGFQGESRPPNSIQPAQSLRPPHATMSRI